MRGLPSPFITSKGQGFESPQLHSNQLDLDFGVPAGHRRVGAENSVMSRDLHVFVDEAAEPVSS